MAKLNALIFDKDGTLFEFAATWESVTKAHFTNVTNGDVALATQIGAATGFDYVSGTFKPDSMIVAATSSEVMDVVQPFLPHLDRADLINSLHDLVESAPQVPAVPLRPLFDDLKSRGLVLGVATNDAEQNAKAHLEQAGIADLFDFVAGYDSGFGGKPAPGQLNAFARQFELDPATVAMVGDSTHDLHAGQAAGMHTIAVLTGMALADDLAPYADVVLDTIGGIPAWLDQMT